MVIFFFVDFIYPSLPPPPIGNLFSALPRPRPPPMPTGYRQRMSLVGGGVGCLHSINHLARLLKLNTLFIPCRRPGNWEVFHP